MKNDLLALCNHFYDHDLDLHAINKSVICLIPKEKDVKLISKFRPINLVNCSFKIISNILTNRLNSIINRIIDVSQSGFIKHRYILDNVVLSQELIHHRRINNVSGVVIKVNFENAYNKIHWECILEILQSRGFSHKWCRWIKD